MPFETTLSPELQAFAKKEIGEYPSARESAIRILRDKIALEPGLKANTNDDFLVRFLRGSKYDIDKALLRLKNYYLAKNQDFSKDLLPSALRRPVMDNVSCAMKGYHSKDGSKVIVNRPGLWKAGDETYPFVDVLRTNMMVCEYVLKDEAVQVSGITVILDGTGVGWDHAKVLASGVAKQMVHLIQEAMPLRIKAIHYVNEPPMIGYIFGLVRQFMNDKIVSRIKFHAADLESLHQHVDPDSLPEHLGGTQPPLPDKAFVDELINSEDYFVNLGKYYFDDPKALFKTQRQADGKDAKDSGVSGTYRKLNVD